MTGNGNGNGINGNGEWGKVFTPQQRMFVDHWFETNFNGTQAARLAGYGGDDATDGTLAQTASRLLRNVKVQEEISNRWAGHGVTAEEVIATLAMQMRASPGDFMDERGRVDLTAVKANGRRVVKSVKISKDRVELNLECAQRAAELIGKTLGLFRDRVEHSGPDGGPIETRNVGITDDERIRAAATLLDALAAKHSPGDTGGQPAMGAAEQATMGSSAQPG